MNSIASIQEELKDDIANSFLNVQSSKLHSWLMKESGALFVMAEVYQLGTVQDKMGSLRTELSHDP